MARFVNVAAGQLGPIARRESRTAVVARLMALMRQAYANPLYRMAETFTEIAPVGLIVSLVSAILLRNPRFLPAKTPALSPR